MNKSLVRRNLIERQNGEHLHDHAQVLFGWRGQTDCRFKDTGGRIGNGSVALVPASAAHLYQGLNDNSELLVIDVSLSDPYIRALESACDVKLGDTLFQRPEIVSLDADSLPLIDFAAAQLKPGSACNSPLLSCQLVSLFMTQLCQLYQTGVPQPFSQTRIDVGELNHYIDQRFDAPSGNRELAHAMNFSESHFYHLCQRQFGVTPQQYMMNRRLQHAQKLLLKSALPLAALAQEVGFSDASSFSRAYKNHFKETPGSTRQRCGRR